MANRIQRRMTPGEPSDLGEGRIVEESRVLLRQARGVLPPICRRLDLEQGHLLIARFPIVTGFVSSGVQDISSPSYLASQRIRLALPVRCSELRSQQDGMGAWRVKVSHVERRRLVGVSSSFPSRLLGMDLAGKGDTVRVGWVCQRRPLPPAWCRVERAFLRLSQRVVRWFDGLGRRYPQRRGWC